VLDGSYVCTEIVDPPTYGDTGGIDQNIQPTEVRVNRSHEFRNRHGICLICLDWKRANAGGADGGSDLLCACSITSVAKGDVGTVSCQPSSDRRTNPPRSTRNDSNFAA